MAARSIYNYVYTYVYTHINYTHNYLYTIMHTLIYVLYMIDSGLVGSLGGHHESRGCSQDTYPEPFITKYTSVQR